MQLRCYRCGWSFAIKQEEIEFALQTLQETNGSHYDVRCTRCRHINKIPLEQLQRAVPQPRERDQATEDETGEET